MSTEGKNTFVSKSFTRKCKTCGKLFEKTDPDWGYRIRDNLYCTYGCMRKAEKVLLAKKNAKRGCAVY